MQHLKISHLTNYQFSSPVTLQPHRLLLRPREGHDVRIESSNLEITSVHQIRWHRDVFDNSVAVASFREPLRELAIASEVVIEQYDEAPLDFVVADYAVSYPFEYYGEAHSLAPFQRSVYPNDAGAVSHWLDSLGVGRGSLETYVLLDRINQAIANSFTYIRRDETGVQPPGQTLAKRSGSCRDFAALFIEACRYLGLASRFVSGYLHSPAIDAGNGSTHAWAEVYLPGPGWKGFDPTIGEVAGGGHIAVAVACHPEAVPPVAGGFFGPIGPTPIMAVSVQVTAV